MSSLPPSSLNAPAVTRDGKGEVLPLEVGKCPDHKGFCVMLEDKAWRARLHRCTVCQEELRRSDLRWDVTTPASNPGDLLCRDCWEHIADYQQGSALEPSFRTPPWPADEGRDTVAAPYRLEYGSIVDRATSRAIGIARGYNPRDHSATNVALFAFPGRTEPTTLETSWTVNPLPDAR